MTDPNKKTQRTLALRDGLWGDIKKMSEELECSVDYLVNESLKAYLRTRLAGVPSASPFGALEAELQRAIQVGKAFVFLPKSAFGAKESSWAANLLWRGREPEHLTLTRVGRAPLLLPGGKLGPAELPSLNLAVVTSDKALYREGKDAARLLALDPLSPGARATVDVHLNGAEYAKHVVELDACGAAALELRDLPTGDYKVKIAGAPPISPACAFTVAEYRLAPLVASMTSRSVSGEPQALSFELLLETFGAPLDGAVKLELMDGGKRAAETTAEAKDGVVKASLPLTGKGPHAINVLVKADPSKTASVPIVGSREEERSLTTFSALGAEVRGSLLPSEGSRAVRGIFLEEGAHNATPFRLERVDCKRARIVAASAAEAVSVVVIDPTAPSPRKDAINPDDAPHPGLEDGEYRRADALFRDGKIKEALEAFEAALPKGTPAHPNYHYGIACCHARLGDVVRAMSALRAAVVDGWRDLAYLAADDDLKALRGLPAFEALVAGGAREITRSSVASGDVIEVDTPSPMGLILIGAFIKDKAWEGWATTIAPEGVKPTISTPKHARPGSVVTIDVEASLAGAGARSSAYVIVKDARLLGIDTPGSRLAGCSKAYAEAASEKLEIGSSMMTLEDALPRPVPPPSAVFSSTLAGSAPRGRPGMVLPSAPMAEGAMPPPMARAITLGSPPAPGRPPGGARPSAAPPGGAPPPAPMMAAAPEMVAFAAAPAPPGAPPPVGGKPTEQAAGAGPGPYRSATAVERVRADDPEVLFAGLLPIKDGRASVSLRLGEAFTDYLVEAFVISGLDWAPVEARFRAAKELFAELEVPVFVHPDNTAVGRVHAGASSERMKVRVTRGGADVQLFKDGKPLNAGDEISGARVELSFLCGPGDYEAVVEDVTGKTPADRVQKRVDEPGKMRRIARSLRLLEPGEAISLSDDPSYQALRLLPGLDKPFKALVDATGDYSHACCEQTAAKILAACAMYALSEEPARRERAESIILAGVRREKLMWLKGRGFKIYPEWRDEPNTYYGPMAARYLWNLSLLEDVAGGKLSPALARGVDDGLTMAGDTTAAYDIEWPPRKPKSAEDVYAALRFGKGAPGSSLLGFAKTTAEGVTSNGSPAGGAVAKRAEAAYASASLLRGGGSSDRKLALACANVVVEAIGDEGRLYSTIDSVAAIALMAELSAARLIKGSAGDVEIDGKRTPASKAMEAASPRSIRAIDGAAAVEVTRIVEEDWEGLRGDVPMRVSLSKGGSARRQFSAGDAVDLLISLDTGYKPGDLVWVCLPDALSRVVGGGQVKRFSIDLEGKNQLSVSLAATGLTVDKDGTQAPQKFAVCLRNMFEEERASSVGLLDVTVGPSADPTPEPEGSGGSFFGRMKRALFGD